MNIISLFDGMSCGQIALNRAGIKYNNYYASEIDKTAIKVTQHNFPKTIQLGDITKIKGGDLPEIDLLIGGSPCQSFSIAGNKTGFDGKSKLFWEYHRVLNEVKPKYFLLENVKMRKIWEDVISEALNVSPVLIDSKYFSAQNRKRLYWTNIPILPYTDKGIKLSDIINNYNSQNLRIDERKKQILKSSNKIIEINSEYIILEAKNKKKVYIDLIRDSPYTFYETRTQEGKDERRRIRKETGIDSTPRSKEFKMYYPLKENKANCLVTIESTLDYIIDYEWIYRPLNLKEQCYLQTVPENYFDGVVSNNQARKLLGNGWTVDVITHILKSIL